MEYPVITEKYLQTHSFKRTGLEAAPAHSERMLARFSSTDGLPKSDGEKMMQLRIELANLILAKWKTFPLAAANTDTNYDTLRKYVSTGEKRKISRFLLAKIAVAAELSVEQANALFVLQEFPLEPEYVQLDAVVVHCLQNHDDLDEFYRTCDQIHLKYN